MSWFGKKAQPKEEHPMQEIWDQGEWYRRHSPPEGGSVIAPPSHEAGQSNRATLRLMKSIEEQISQIDQHDREAAQKELQAMVARYDGEVPFPEFVERYTQDHPSKYDFSTIAKFIIPLNDPRLIGNDRNSVINVQLVRDYRIDATVPPSPRIDHRLIGKEYR